MPQFGIRSRYNLKNVHKDLVKLAEAVVEKYDCTVLSGYRGKDEQDDLFHSGQSKLEYPNSKHNKSPSRAIDLVPYPIDWQNKERFYHFAGYVKSVADSMGLRIRWGGDWDMDGEFKDQTFHDLPHFELINIGLPSGIDA